MRQLAQPVSEDNRREAQYRYENRDWLKKSAQIAFAVRRELRKQGLSQQELAERMNVSPQYVGKLLKGKDNLTLETISKMEKALDCSLVRVQGMSDSQENVARQTAMYVFSIIFGQGMDAVRINVNHSQSQAVPQLS